MNAMPGFFFSCFFFYFLMSPPFPTWNSGCPSDGRGVRGFPSVRDNASVISLGLIFSTSSLI